MLLMVRVPLSPCPSPNIAVLHLPNIMLTTTFLSHSLPLPLPLFFYTHAVLPSPTIPVPLKRIDVFTYCMFVQHPEHYYHLNYGSCRKYNPEAKHIPMWSMGSADGVFIEWRMTD